MGDSTLTRACALILLTGALGCVVPATPAAYTPAKNAQRAGPKQLGTEAEVAREYACNAQRAPLLVLEESSLRPTPLAAGQEFGHRIVYALCPARAKQPLAGTLRTRIRFGSAVVVDDSADFAAQPGRWAVDTFIALPPQAKPGAYELELEFTPAAGAVRFATKMPFSVWMR
ncbi:MAG TPA: hypothetical protein VII78_05235 [Myxococcota bacterium]|jgi:hypothetical protein